MGVDTPEATYMVTVDGDVLTWEKAVELGTDGWPAPPVQFEGEARGLGKDAAELLSEWLAGMAAEYEVKRDDLGMKARPA